MARVITTEPLKIQERTTVCKNCNSKVAFNEKEVFLDLSYGASLALTVIIIFILAYSKLLNTCSYECKIIEDIS